MSRKIKRRVKKNKNDLPTNIDLIDLNKQFIKFCAKILREGDINKVERIIDFMDKLSQTKKLTYEKAFILKHLERHGLTVDDYLLAKEI